MALNTWLIYLLAAIGLSLSPGPNGLLALTHGALHGWRKALFTIFGGAFGFIAVIALSMLAPKFAVPEEAVVVTLSGEWKRIEIPLSGFHFGPAGEGASYQGEPFNNMKIFCDGTGDFRVLLADFEICEAGTLK